ncbi:hypothetical protein AGDE_02382 [Angomonas deanei]|uniref:Uncharacterized protein n=1 Tax=Angomonas deanei TaxID=59799 RepID=S9VEG3_9TRYP|nr:hypothetical protein AGDE_04715 [Angomonas deanei]EPY41531.1 hypothetical protein AGDE_02393 [Angomonas deanei]EPY41542.1 hypothetical protein AGDE_02382 [Angomonas deanei]CAD2218267.1 hypothetical protein, conserved [Angomonas deanei]|eukprot:EPY39213.1 hypothetical protein AGDE_04715 [Angomonas deanei]
MVSYFAVGTYANIIDRYHKLTDAQEDYVVLPLMGNKYYWSALYTSMLAEEIPCSATFTCTDKEGASPRQFSAPLRMLIASQMPLQHGGYSLTPFAMYRHHALSATIATTEASRLRLWHLLSREAVDGLIEEEDGVHTLSNIQKIELKVGDSGGDNSGVLLALDGETVELPPGSEVTVQRCDMEIPFIC